MPAAKFFVDKPSDVGLNPNKVQALMDMETLGSAVQGGIEKPATDDTVFVAMSATTAITSSALRLLIQKGKKRLPRPGRHR